MDGGDDDDGAIDGDVLMLGDDDREALGAIDEDGLMLGDVVGEVVGAMDNEGV